MNIELKKKYVDSWFNYLQSQICNQFELLEKELSPKPKKFTKREWAKNKKKKEGVYHIFLKTVKFLIKLALINRLLVVNLLKSLGQKF